MHQPWLWLLTALLGMVAAALAVSCSGSSSGLVWPWLRLDGFCVAEETCSTE